MGLAWALKATPLAREALAGRRLNLVLGTPGFVSAYWLEPIDGIGMSVIFVETKEHAEEARLSVPATDGRQAADGRDPRGIRQRLDGRSWAQGSGPDGIQHRSTATTPHSHSPRWLPTPIASWDNDQTPSAAPSSGRSSQARLRGDVLWSHRGGQGFKSPQLHRGVIDRTAGVVPTELWR